jgi:preprotein translocase subunit SecY
MQRQQKSSMPRLIQAMVDAFSLPDLRWKLLFTLAMLIVFRFVAHVPVPGVDRAALSNLFQNSALLGMLDLFSGGALRNLSVAAMGVYPYITASIIMQLLVPIIPQLQALQKEGEEGRRKLNQWTHWLMVPLAMMQGYGQLILFQREGIFQSGVRIGLTGDALLPTAAMVLSMTAGTVFLVWIGERITENGIGNGISIIIFGGIVAGMPGNMGQTLVTSGGDCCLYSLCYRGSAPYPGSIFTQPVSGREDVPTVRGYPYPAQGELSGNDTSYFRLLNSGAAVNGGLLFCTSCRATCQFR